MKVIVVGCGRVGSALAGQLHRKRHQVTVIDIQPAAFDNLPVDFRGRTVDGDVLAKSVLHRAEIASADGLAAVTRSDTLNALVAHVARTEYHVMRVVARNYDQRLLPVQQAFGVPIFGAAGWRVQRVEELLTGGPLQTVYYNESAGLVIYRLEVPENWRGRPLGDLLPGGAEGLLAWRRGEKPVTIAEAQQLETGDLIYLKVEPGQGEMLERRLLAGGAGEERPA